MAGTNEIRDAINKNFDSYISELEQTAAVWERKPEGAAEGEDAWCARQVAEHIAGSGLFFGAGVAQAIGVEGPALERIALADADTAVSETRRTHGAFIEVLSQVKDDQLGMEIDHPRLGKQTLAGVLGIVEHHLSDHANQLKALRTS